MIVKSKFNEAVVKSEKLGSGATARIFDLLNTRMVEGEVVKVMPKAEINQTFVEGYTQTYSGGNLDPDILSSDPYCGILGVRFKMIDIDKSLLKEGILKEIPINKELNKKTVIDEKEFKKYLKNQLEKARSLWPEMIKYKGLKETDKLIDDILKRLDVDRSVFWRSFGTLGNHFIEVGQDDEDYLWIFVQSGSRNLGFKFWQYWKKQIYKTRIEKDKMKKAEREIKSSYKGDEAVEKLDNLHKSGKHTISPSRFLINESDISGYLQDLYFIKAYSEFNRKTIIERIAKRLKLEELERIDTTNYSLDLKDKIIRAGSIKTEEGEKVLIKVNDLGFVICSGLDSEDWNYSAPWFIDSIEDLELLEETVKPEKKIKTILKINEK